MNREKPLGMRIGESVFCAGYLVFALVAGCALLVCAPNAGVWARTCGVMTLLLACGDAFHLVPRILVNVQGASSDPDVLRRRAFALGLGNLVSSVTMTIFYLLLFVGMWQMAHPGQVLAFSPMEMGVFCVLCVLAVVRIALCLLPQNRWFDGTGSQAWGIYRNVPFVIMGIITVLCLVGLYGEWLMATLVCASFACYLGVVLGARSNPMLGMLMIPKTVCYIWLIALLLARL
ncbi:MAG: hypothetical protein IKG18_07300 [Atopobiaceae bacterium]|nr:hypothetical protein [Atopobiaceae bacterium]